MENLKINFNQINAQKANDKNSQIQNKGLDENYKNNSSQKVDDNFKIDWNQLKTEYVIGAGPRYLSEKYKIPIDTIKSRIRRESWNKEKKEISETTKLRVREQYAELLIDLQIQVREEYRSIFLKLRDKIKRNIEKCNDLRDISLLIKALVECQKGEFKCFGITEEGNQNLHEAIDCIPVGTTNFSNFHHYKNDDGELEKLLRSYKRH